MEQSKGGIFDKEKMVKIRLIAVKLEQPVELTVMPGVKAMFDENGIAEINESVARILCSNEYPGLYEMIENEYTEIMNDKKSEESLDEFLARIEGQPKRRRKAKDEEESWQESSKGG